MWPAPLQTEGFYAGVCAALCWWLLFFVLLPALDRERCGPCSLRARLCQVGRRTRGKSTWLLPLPATAGGDETRFYWCHLHHWLLYLLLGTACYLAPLGWRPGLRSGGVGFSCVLLVQGLCYRDRCRFCYVLPEGAGLHPETPTLA